MVNNSIYSLEDKKNTFFEIALWCNGNTEDFGSFVPGSNPGGATNLPR